MKDESSPVLKFIVPEDISDQDIHFILKVEDNGSPNLARYRKVMISKKYINYHCQRP